MGWAERLNPRSNYNTHGKGAQIRQEQEDEKAAHEHVQKTDATMRRVLAWLYGKE